MVVLSSYLKEDKRTIEIPLVLRQLKLPMMPEGEAYQLPVRLGEVLILDNRLLVVGVNFFMQSAGDINIIEDMSGGSELYINLKEETLHQVFNFWWDNTEYDKSDISPEVFPFIVMAGWKKPAIC